MLDVRLIVLLLGVLAAAVARADELEVRGLGPAPGQLAARAELQRALGGKVEVRWDPASGCPRSVRFERPVPLEAADPVEAARELLVRLEPLFGRLAVEGRSAARRDPRLRHAETVAYGKERHVRFGQAVGDVPLDGAEVVVTLARRDGRTVAARVAGRAFKDAPAVVPPAPAPAAGARRLLTLRPDGVWKVADEQVEAPAGGVPTAVLRGLDGSVLARRPLADHGVAQATIWPRWRTRGTARRPLRDLTLLAGDRVATTGDDGSFPGERAELPWGLTGPLERVVPRSGLAFPAAAGGRLALAFDASDPRAAELNVFHHLVEVRRFYGTIAGLERGFVERPTVARLSVDEFNAWCAHDPLTVEGRRFEHALTFGYAMGLDAFCVAHERTHGLLGALGLRSRAGGDARVLHEAYADYLAACYTGDPSLAGAGLGHQGRTIEEDRVYPQDYEGGADAHRDSVIFSGALWDARRAAGADAGLVDAAAVRAVPGLGHGPTLRGAARLLLDGAAPAVQPVLETHLRRHGLLEDPDAPPPAVAFRRAGLPEQSPGFALAAGAAVELVVSAWDPAEQREGRPARVTILLDGPGFVARRAAAGQAPDAAAREASATFDLRPAAADVGDHVLTVVAESLVSGKTTARTLQVTVLPADAPRGDVAHLSTFVAVQVGQRLAIPARALFPGLSAAPSRLHASGQLSAGAALVDGHLVLAPEPGDEGFHRFAVHALLEATARDARHEPTCEVVVRVGGRDGPWIEVLRVATERGLPDEVMPGQPVLVHAGTRLALQATALFAPGEGTAAPPRDRCRTCGAWPFDDQAPTCERCGAPLPPPAAPPPSPVLVLRDAPAWVTAAEATLGLELQVAPPVDGPRRSTFTLAVVQRRDDGTEVALARRVVEVVVLPAPARPAPAAEPARPRRGLADVVRELGR